MAESLGSGSLLCNRRPCFGLRNRVMTCQRFGRVEMAMMTAPLRIVWMIERVERRPDRR